MHLLDYLLLAVIFTAAGLAIYKWNKQGGDCSGSCAGCTRNCAAKTTDATTQANHLYLHSKTQEQSMENHSKINR